MADISTDQVLAALAQRDAELKGCIRALASLEQTAIMLEKWAPETFPTGEDGKVHFARAMMESAAEAIRTAWADAIKAAERACLKITGPVTASDRVRQLAHEILGDRCACYAEAWPGETCEAERDKAANAIEAEIGFLRRALQGLMDNVEAVARDSFATSAETFEDDFKLEDPTGYAAWSAGRDALAASA